MRPGDLSERGDVTAFFCRLSRGTTGAECKELHAGNQTSLEGPLCKLIHSII